MYKVLLVDDERIILDGIREIVDWTSLGTRLDGTYRNGVDAFERIRKDPPDIVITDIRMPGMDGLELVSRTTELHPRIRFIMLSGFRDFNYAKTAMQYGVKHYLLKPCSETDIKQALAEVVGEIRQDEQKEQFFRTVRDGLQKVLPHAKEQFLKEFVTNKMYGKKDWDYYRKLFNLELDHHKVRLMLFHLEGEFEFEHMFAVKNIAEDVLGIPLLSTTIGEHVLILIEDFNPIEQLYARIDKIRETFFKYYKIDTTVALSDADNIANARKLYKETLECLNHRFYVGEGSLITKNDVSPHKSRQFVYDEDPLCMLVQSGRWEDAEKEINEFFAALQVHRLDIHETKTAVIHLFLSIIRLCESEQIHAYMQHIGEMAQMDTLQAIRDFFERIAREITMRFYEQNRDKHSAVARRMIEIVREHIGNPELSLQWVARQMLYMNANYLGKLFKKETGEKFNQYVTRMRIEKAVDMIEQAQDVKIFEIADALGYGDHPQYFSQVFKKMVGCSPSEYKKINEKSKDPF